MKIRFEWKLHDMRYYRQVFRFQWIQLSTVTRADVKHETSGADPYYCPFICLSICLASVCPSVWQLAGWLVGYVLVCLTAGSVVVDGQWFWLVICCLQDLWTWDSTCPTSQGVHTASCHPASTAGEGWSFLGRRRHVWNVPTQTRFTGCVSLWQFCWTVLFDQIFAVACEWIVTVWGTMWQADVRHLSVSCGHLVPSWSSCWYELCDRLEEDRRECERECDRTLKPEVNIWMTSDLDTKSLSVTERLVWACS